MRIGVLGAGQLGRMLALAGYPLAQTFVFHDLSGAPSAGIGAVIVDPQASRIDEFLDQVDVVTYEFEHLPVEQVRHIEQRKPLYPSAEAIRVCQNRAEEKALLTRLAIPVPAYRIVDSAEALAEAARELGCPVVAKSITEGYDGKGQAVLRQPDDAAQAWARIGHAQLIVEAFVNFRREVSIIAARSRSGEIRFYPMAENVHVDGILRYSIAPAPGLHPQTQETAEHYMRSLLSELNYVGVLALELFETDQGLLANEMAPRVHNSGHWTQNGAPASQFENHLRAICDWPLGDTQALKPTCMINIIGEPGDTAALLRLPYAHLHLYDKAPRAGRKLGHINVTADTYQELVWRTRNVASLLPGCPELRTSLDVRPG
ncbi:MAG: 5-(carboxyamino)imidazole ribonucleotide synthase [Gammaproteobacteria bacterium]|nr:5-(carboxyamino)imidazole ribonucleotide synthase [Gammaproteobacteria bacterium]